MRIGIVILFCLFLLSGCSHYTKQNSAQTEQDLPVQKPEYPDEKKEFDITLPELDSFNEYFNLYSELDQNGERLWNSCQIPVLVDFNKCDRGRFFDTIRQI
ncbi:MAG: hypothetical protein GX660_10705 [Clostridiaceae bacterium]|nr:hypothetical protein [Clostridiaceae bacterium]